MTLPWFRADTNFPTHDKVIELVGNGIRGKAAGFVYWCAMAQIVGNEGDGSIKKGQLPFMHGTVADAKLLVEVGLWDVTEKGWQIHNFGTRQVVGASEQVKADEISAARSAAGKTGANGRWVKD